MWAAETEARAAVFAALGDPTRLHLLARLQGPGRHSIAALTAGTDLTRQAVTKHLKVLEGAGVLRAERAGREQHFTLQPQALQDTEAYLRAATQGWESRLAGLKQHLDGES